MYQGYTVARSLNHSCLPKAISVTYSLFLSVAVVIQHEKPVRRITFSSNLSGFTTFFTSLTRHFFFGGGAAEFLYVKCVF